MATTYVPNASNASETLTLPEPGDPGEAETVNVPFRQVSDRMKGLASVYDKTLKIVQSLSTWLVNDSNNNGVAIEGTATGTSDAVGVRGIGQYGIWGQTVGSTLLHAGMVGKALAGLAIGVYGESVGGPALEGNGTSGQFALRLRGITRWAQSAGISDAVMNPAHTSPQENTLTPKHLVKAWCLLRGGVIMDGLNISGVTIDGNYAQFTMVTPMSGLEYAIAVTETEGVSGNLDIPIQVLPFPTGYVGTYQRTTSSFWVRAVQPQVPPAAIGGNGIDIRYVGVPISQIEFLVMVLGKQPIPTN